MTGKAIGINLKQGFLGTPSRTTPIPEIFTRPAGTKLEFGQPVKVDTDGNFVPFAEGDTIDLFAGVVTRGVQQATGYFNQNGEVGYDEKLPAAVLKKGFIVVNVGTSLPKPNGNVYILDGAFSADDSGTLLPSAKFTTGVKDADNNVEIEIGYLPIPAQAQG